ncbi:MAG: DNA repair protein RadC [Bacteroidales bacterium]|nr:DNA repair protein RadC [Bacteroidales bacterium]
MNKSLERKGQKSERTDETSGKTNESQGRTDQEKARTNEKQGKRIGNPEETNERPGSTDVRPEETNENQGRTDVRPEETNERPGSTDVRPEETNENQGRTDVRPEETNENQGRTDVRPEKTTENQGITDVRPEKTTENQERMNVSPKGTDRSPEETDKKPKEMNRKPEKTNEGPKRMNESLEKMNGNQERINMNRKKMDRRSGKTDESPVGTVRSSEGTNEKSKGSEWLDEMRQSVAENEICTLSDGDLLDLILNSGSRYICPKGTGESVLRDNGGSLTELGNKKPEDMMRYKNIGRYRSFLLATVLEVGKRMMGETPHQRPVVQSSESAFELIRNDFRGLEHEECWALYMNRANGLIAKERVSMGGVSSTTLDPRIIVKRAVELLASSIIIAHNHPSGNLLPGEYDKSMTSALRKASALFSITLLDHLVIAGNKFFSFSDEGL